MLITARCDIEQDKVTVYNYIPVVPVEDWLLKDGIDIIAKRSLNNEIGAMKKALADAGLSASILDLIEHKDILRELQKASDKSSKALAKRFEKAIKEHEKSYCILQLQSRPRKNAFSYLEHNDGLYKTLIKDLMTNGLAEYHYIECCDFGEETRGYVALMREIRFISSTLGKRIAIGLDKGDYDNLSSEFSPELNHLRFLNENDFAMPLSGIASPFIEFIMQRFANLFSRIGVEDIPKEKINAAHSWVKSMQGAAA